MVCHQSTSVWLYMNNYKRAVEMLSVTLFSELQQSETLGTRRSSMCSSGYQVSMSQ